MKDKIKYPIGAKLVVIITIICLFIAGAITVLVSVLVSEDVRITAEDNNFTVNKRSAQEAESFLGTIRGNTLMLLDTLNVLGSVNAASGLVTDFFFERNQEIAYVGIIRRAEDARIEDARIEDAPMPENYTLIRNLINNRFFLSKRTGKRCNKRFFCKLSEHSGTHVGRRNLACKRRACFWFSRSCAFFSVAGSRAA